MKRVFSKRWAEAVVEALVSLCKVAAATGYVWAVGGGCGDGSRPDEGDARVSVRAHEGDDNRLKAAVWGNVGRKWRAEVV